MACELCTLLQSGNFKELLLLETEHALALFSDKPASKGHIIVLPKNHFVILEHVPDEILSELFLLANACSTAIFDALMVQGTNILIQNGSSAGQVTPHFMIHVLGREDKDNVQLSWNPIQLSEEVLLKQQDLIKRALQTPVGEKMSTPRDLSKEKENYILKQLDRIA